MPTRRNCIVSLFIFLVATTVLISAPSNLKADISSRDAQALARAELIYVATIRKDGHQSTSAPVWFTLSADKKAILIQTRRTTWKAKRIKRGSLVLVWIGTASGPAFIGKAAITTDRTVQDKILADYRVKYWQNRVLGIGPSRGEFDKGDVVAIIITPSRDLPDGFKSEPGTAPPPLENSGQ